MGYLCDRDLRFFLSTVTLPQSSVGVRDVPMIDSDRSGSHRLDLPLGLRRSVATVDRMQAMNSDSITLPMLQSLLWLNRLKA